MFKMQRTLQQKITCQGVGLHSGKTVTMTLYPAPVNHGIQFKRLDVDTQKAYVKADYRNVTKTQLCTCITNRYDVSVLTIEHLMAALYACGVHNALIELDSGEVPIMDGSADAFVFMIDTAGYKTQDVARPRLRLRSSVMAREGDKYIRLLPADQFHISLQIAFDHPCIGKQSYQNSITPMSFRTQISRARTFGFLHDVEKLHSQGLALGGGLNNAIVLDNQKILNKSGIRYPDEFVRHKVLDMIGDLSLAGVELCFSCVAYKAGHALNNKILRVLFADSTLWQLDNAKDSEFVLPATLPAEFSSMHSEERVLESIH